MWLHHLWNTPHLYVICLFLKRLQLRLFLCLHETWLHVCHVTAASFLDWFRSFLRTWTDNKQHRRTDWGSEVKLINLINHQWDCRPFDWHRQTSIKGWVHVFKKFMNFSSFFFLMYESVKLSTKTGSIQSMKNQSIHAVTSSSDCRRGWFSSWKF